MTTEEKQLGSLENESKKRKERLKNLKRKIEEGKKPQFRSYKPIDKNITDNVIKTSANINDVEENISEHLELTKTPIVVDEIDLSKLAPKKQDWDLKRDISKKLERLDFMTQKSIAELIRDRLKNNQEDLLQAVSVGTNATT